MENKNNRLTIIKKPDGTSIEVIENFTQTILKTPEALEIEKAIENEEGLKVLRVARKQLVDLKKRVL